MRTPGRNAEGHPHSGADSLHEKSHTRLAATAAHEAATEKAKLIYACCRQNRRTRTALVIARQKVENGPRVVCERTRGRPAAEPRADRASERTHIPRARGRRVKA
eukprot:5502864-Prymnesium_polylepis.1